MNYVDLIIVTGLVAYVVIGARRGALALPADFTALALAILLALRLYASVSNLIVGGFGMSPSYAKAVGFMCLLLVSQAFLGVMASRLLRLVPLHWHENRANHCASVIPAMARGPIIAGAVLLLLVAMPATRHLTPDIERGAVGGPILDGATAAERVFEGGLWRCPARCSRVPHGPHRSKCERRRPRPAPLCSTDNDGALD